jgi:hypothetical protein
MKRHILKFAFGALGFVATFSAAVMWLWNALIPDIFGITAINYWQALGLLVLARLLFSGFGGRGKMLAGGFRKNPIHEKWMKMTLEERKEFVKKHRFHHHFDGFAQGYEHHHSAAATDDPNKQDERGKNE